MDLDVEEEMRMLSIASSPGRNRVLYLLLCHSEGDFISGTLYAGSILAS